MSCDSLTLYYNPDSAKTAITDLTLFTSGVIKKNIIQFDFILYNKEGTYVGDANVLNNLCIYEKTPNITNTISNYCFTINDNTFIDKYALISENQEQRNTSGLVVQSSIRFFNLQSSEGTQKYTKLKWILPVDKEGNPLTRTLIFYN